MSSADSEILIGSLYTPDRCLRRVTASWVGFGWFTEVKIWNAKEKGVLAKRDPLLGYERVEIHILRALGYYELFRDRCDVRVHVIFFITSIHLVKVVFTKQHPEEIACQDFLSNKGS